jgi:hypothetical protein
MFERWRIRREFGRIVASLSGSELLPVDPDIYQFFAAQEKDAAALMRRKGWTAFGTCIFLITDVCGYLAENGNLRKIREESERLYKSLESLYGFAVLATGKRPDAEACFRLPEDGRNPFAEA